MREHIPAPTKAAVPADVRRALKLATWTDTRFIDPLLGFLLPGAGDAIGAVVGLYIVVVARRHGAPRPVLARMMFNLGIDCLAGVVPFVGDLIDLVNRANLRNARLLERHLSALKIAGTATAGAATMADERPRSLAVPIAVLVTAIAAALALTYLFALRWSRGEARSTSRPQTYQPTADRSWKVVASRPAEQAGFRVKAQGGQCEVFTTS